MVMRDAGKVVQASVCGKWGGEATAIVCNDAV